MTGTGAAHPMIEAVRIRALPVRPKPHAEKGNPTAADTLAIALTIAGTGAALAAPNTGLFTGLRAGVRELHNGQSTFAERMSAVETEQARTCARLEGLALIGRAAPARDAP